MTGFMLLFGALLTWASYVAPQEEVAPNPPFKFCPPHVHNLCTHEMCTQAVSLPYPGDCSRFCICNHFGPIEFSCPDGLVFDSADGVCNWPYDCMCSIDEPNPCCDCDYEQFAITYPPTTRPPCTTTIACSTTTGAPVVRCPDCVNNYCDTNACNLAVNVPYPGDCSKFCKCDHGGAVEFNCPAGTVFNPDLQVCDWPANVNCGPCKSMSKCS